MKNIYIHQPNSNTKYKLEDTWYRVTEIKTFIIGNQNDPVIGLGTID